MSELNKFLIINVTDNDVEKLLLISEYAGVPIYHDFRIQRTMNDYSGVVWHKDRSRNTQLQRTSGTGATAVVSMKSKGYSVYTSVDHFVKYIIENNISGVYNVPEV